MTKVQALATDHLDASCKYAFLVLKTTDDQDNGAIGVYLHKPRIYLTFAVSRRILLGRGSHTVSLFFVSPILLIHKVAK